MSPASGCCLPRLLVYSTLSPFNPRDFILSDEFQAPAFRPALEAASVVFTNGDEPGVKLRKVEG